MFITLHANIIDLSRSLYDLYAFENEPLPIEKDINYMQYREDALTLCGIYPLFLFISLEKKKMLEL